MKSTAIVVSQKKQATQPQPASQASRKLGKKQRDKAERYFVAGVLAATRDNLRLEAANRELAKLSRQEARTIKQSPSYKALQGTHDEAVGVATMSLLELNGGPMAFDFLVTIIALASRACRETVRLGILDAESAA